MFFIILLTRAGIAASWHQLRLRHAKKCECPIDEHVELHLFACSKTQVYNKMQIIRIIKRAHATLTDNVINRRDLFGGVDIRVVGFPAGRLFG